MSDQTWYYNVEAGAAETGPSKRGFGETRLGPFASETEAKGALERLHARNDAADAEDEAWRNGS